MPLIASEDYVNKRIFLGVDSVGVDVLPIDIYKEHRERRRLNANDERYFPAMVSALGNQQIGPTKFTPRFTDLASGVKIVPFDTTHALRIRAALVSIEDQLEGADLFDRSSLLANVDIDYQPPQVEIITVATGGALTSEQDSRLTTLFNATTAGTGATAFSEAALANAPTGGGGGGLDAAGVRDAIGLAAANLDAQLGDIPTNPLLTTDGRLNTLDATISSRQPSGDVTVGGYAAGQSPSDLVDLSPVTDAILTGGDIASALTTYDAATGAQVAAAGFPAQAAADLAAVLIAAEAVQSAAEAVADGRHTINYTASTATQYNADGSPRTTFDLLDAAGNSATSGQTAVERNPQ